MLVLSLSSLRRLTFSTCVCCVRAEDTKKFAALPAALTRSHNILVIISACRLVNILTSPASHRRALQAARMRPREKRYSLAQQSQIINGRCARQTRNKTQCQS
jgi:hypothetical protein